MERPWFDEETGILLLDDYVLETESYRRITQDAVITDEELDEQAHRVIAKLRDLEAALAPESKSVATEALCELAVLSILQSKRAGSNP